MKTIKHYEPPGTPQRHAATTRVYFDGLSKCAKTTRILGRGDAAYMSVRIETNRGSDADWGNYAYHAGPVSVRGAGFCIRLRVEMDSTKGYPYFPDYESGNTVCN